MPDPQPSRIGLTGNIACGKSLVAEMLRELGAETIDADRVAHEIMQPGSAVLDQIAQRFGGHVINQDGSLNRPELGNIVFTDPEALADLESIVHPPTVQAILDQVATSIAPVVVIDAIKLFESGLAEHCGQIWVVYCDPETQIARLMERNGLDEASARQRINAQPPQDEKIARADVVIDNSGSIAATREQVRRAWERVPVA